MDPLQKKRLNGLLLGTSCLVASSLMVLPALAGNVATSAHPTGGNIVSGNAKIGDHGRKITQTSEKAFIDWTSFNIGSGQTVRIKGPNKNAVTVNRVTGVDASEIDGALRANDNVWLLNGNGILFGKGSIINVGSLIATTSDLSDDDFKKGKYRFRAGSNPNASVINKGTITAGDSGTVVLSAAHVANEGVVQANLGSVVLGGANAFTVDLNGDNLIRYQVTGEVKQAPTDSKGAADKALVSNSGRIVADGGTVLMTSRAASNVQDNVVNNSGMIEATSVGVHDGEVDLNAGTLDKRQDGYNQNAGTVDDSGRIDVAGNQNGETGGTVRMTAANVVVADGAHIAAQGYNGGGTVLIGGELHGSSGLKRAGTVTIGKAVIDANATHKGDGGKVAIWSRHDTSFSGTVEAEGGRYGGNGGFVETSGRSLSVGDDARVITLAGGGRAGTWLLDPSSVAICSDASDCCGTFAASNITAASIQANLNGGNVEIDAEGSSASFIIVRDQIAYTSTNTLSFLSQGSIQIDANIKNSGSGNINLVAGWDGSTGVAGSNVNMALILATSGAYGGPNGSVTLGQQFSSTSVAVGSNGGVVTVAAEDLNIGPPNGCQTANFQLGYNGNGGGDIDVVLTGNLTIASDQGGYSQIGNGDASRANTGITNVGGDIVLNVDGITTLSGAGGRTAWIGNVASSNSDSESGSVTLITGSFVVNSNGSADNSLFGNMVASDLTGAITTATSGQGGSGGGDFTLAFTGGSPVSLSTYMSNGLDFANGNTLSIVSTNTLNIDQSIQAVENGNINLVGGWDGTTGIAVAGGALNVATLIAHDGYGNNGGDVNVGGTGDVAVGTFAGNTTVVGSNVSVSPAGAGQGAIGYLGQSTGDITVDATGNVAVSAPNGGFAHIGNLGSSTTGDASGNITISAGDEVVLAALAGDAQIGNGGANSNGNFSGNITVGANGAIALTATTGGYAQIGNGGAGSNDSSHAGSNSGNISVTGASVELSAGSVGGAYTQIGNGGAGTNEASGSTNSGNISVTTLGGGDIILMGGSDGGSNEQDVYAQIGMGGPFSGSSATGSGANKDTGNITINSSGNVTLSGGTDADEQNGFALIGDAGTAQKSGNISVTATGNVTITGGTATGQPDFGGISNSFATIGDVNSGAITSNITITANELTISGGSSSVGDGAQIGNNSSDSSVAGNITINTASVNLNAPDGDDLAFIGNVGTGSVAGNIKITTSGDVSMTASGYDATVSIGNYTSSNAGTTGNVTLNVGGSLSMYAHDGGIYGEHSSAYIGSQSSSSNIKVTAAQNISMGTGNSFGYSGHNNVRIGNYGANKSNSSAGGNITVTATHGDITLSSYTYGAVLIGNGPAVHTSGDITVKAGGAISVNSEYKYAVARIGNSGADGATSGNIKVTAGGAIALNSEDKYSVSQIGNGGGDMQGAASGNIVVSGHSLNVSSSSPGGNYQSSYAVIGNGDVASTGHGAASGSITITTTGLSSINDAGYAWIGNLADGSSKESGDVTFITGALDVSNNVTADGSFLGGMIRQDLGTSSSTGGNFTLAFTNTTGSSITGANGDQTISDYFKNGMSFNSPHTLSFLSTKNIVIGRDVQNSGSGDIDVVAGWDGTTTDASKFTNAGVYGNSGGAVTVDAASDSVSVGSKSGKTTVAAADVHVTGSADGSAQIGYSGAGIGNVAVFATGNVTLTAGTASSECEDNCFFYAQIGNGGDAGGNVSKIGGNVSVIAGGNITLTGAEDSYALIGNGGDDITANITGNIAVSTSGGSLTLNTTNTVFGIASIGDLSGGGSGKESSNITINTNGGALTLTSSGSQTVAQIGNWATENGSGAISGDFTIDAGAINLNSTGVSSSAQIGSGNYIVFASDPSAITGNITVNATSVSLLGRASDSASREEARIGNLGEGPVSGTVTVTTVGDVTLTSGADGQVSIGDYSSSFGNAPSSQTNATTTVNAGDSVLLSVDGAGGYVSIEVGGAASGSVNITAKNDITVDASNGGFALIGGQTYGNGGVDVSLRSKNGDIDFEADDGNEQIGNFNIVNGGNVSGNVSVTANNGNITLSGDDGDVQIGNSNGASGTAGGNITLIAGGNLDLTADDEGTAQIGNGQGVEKAVSGNIAITVAGTTTVDTPANGSVAWIGNMADKQSDVSGSVSIISGDFDISDDAAGDTQTFLGDDIQSGDLTLGITDQNANLPLAGSFDYSSSHDLTLLAAGDLTIASDIQNSGSGDITVDAGGTVRIGGSGATGAVAVGSKHGTTTVDSVNLVVDAENGAAQLGFRGAGTGDIIVDASGLVAVGGDASGFSAQIGNGGAGVTANTSGDITIDAASLDVIAANGSAAQIGNGGFLGGGSASGNITLDVTGAFIEGVASNAYAQVGDGGYHYNGNANGAISLTAASAEIGADGSSADVMFGNGGDGSQGNAGGNVSIDVSGNLNAIVDGADLAAQIGNGGVGSNGTDSGGVTLDVGGKFSANTGGANGSSYIQFGNGGFDAQGASSGNVTVDAKSISLVADIVGYVQIGNGGDSYNGNASGNVSVSASKNIVADAKGDSTYVQIGNGGFKSTGTDAGNIVISAGKNLNLEVDGSGSSADIGNFGTHESGDVTIDAATLTASSGAFILADAAILAIDGGVGSASNPLDVDANSLAITTQGGNAYIAVPQAVSIGVDNTGVNLHGGNLVLTADGAVTQTEAISADTVDISTDKGGIALTDADNAISTAALSTPGNASLYDSTDLTIDGASAGGNLTLLTEGNLTFVSSVQLANGDLLAVAGWDGTTTKASSLTKSGAYGNHGGSIVIGGHGASGNVAVGSANGSTTLAGANVSLEADNGYAQVGYHGAASDDITVLATNNVTLSGGNGTGQYAQIGNGGANTQKDAHKYTESGNITVSGQNVELIAGSGDDSYAQIGNGGFEIGEGLTGQGNNEGAVTVTAADLVTLAGGNGADAYAQIGNGGDHSNFNAGSNAGGTDGGDITVTAGTGVSMTAGAGQGAYVQIGNGGLDVNGGPNSQPDNFSITGTIDVSDLGLTGSDTGNDGYAQIGNGDGSGGGVADVSGNITIDAGKITVTNGKANNANATIANAIGDGTVSGTVTGYSNSSQNDAGTQGAISSTIQQTSQTAQQVSLVVSTQPPGPQSNIDNGPGQSSGPLEQLAGGKEADEGADSATDALGQSLGGHKHIVQTVSLIPGVLTQLVSTDTAHGIPPANQDFSSWGNEALWRW